jgi:hypothetical protein
MIKSSSEEDIHKAIKYNVWTSTKQGNQTLDKAFKIALQDKGDVILFFSSHGSGRLLGVAKMKTNVEYNKFFPFWTQDNKWGGLFEIEWIFIKDCPVKELVNIEIEMKDGKVRPVTYSRDAQEVPNKEGKEMLDIVDKHFHTNTILEHFEYYDLRQANYELAHPLEYQNQTQSENKNSV